MSKLKGTPVPNDFQPDDNTVAWLARKYPDVDPVEAVERFLEWACNYRYENHQRSFQGFVNRLNDDGKIARICKKKKSPVELRKEQVAERGRLANFRPPNPGESVDDYERAIDAMGKADVMKLGNMLRSVGR